MRCVAHRAAAERNLIMRPLVFNPNDHSVYDADDNVLEADIMRKPSRDVRPLAKRLATERKQIVFVYADNGREAIDCPATLCFRVSSATFEAVQLDSPDNVRGMGLDPDGIRWLKHGAVITATREQLIAFADYLDPRCISEDYQSAQRRAIARDRMRLLALPE
jgi:hypothetical protein